MSISKEAFYHACEEGDIETVSNFITQDKLGEDYWWSNYVLEAFEVACAKGHVKIVALMLSIAKPDFKRALILGWEKLYIPFFEACINGHDDIAKLLLDHVEPQCAGQMVEKVRKTSSNKALNTASKIITPPLDMLTCIFDFDNTLTLDQDYDRTTARPLVFESDIKTVFLEHQKRGNHLIICSRQSTIAGMKASLEAIGVDTANITFKSGREIDSDARITLALKESFSATSVTIVDDSFYLTQVGGSTKYNPNLDHPRLTHLLVPGGFDDNGDFSIRTPYYLYASLLSADKLSNIKNAVKDTINECNDSAFMTNTPYTAKLDTVYVHAVYHSGVCSLTKVSEIMKSFLADKQPEYSDVKEFFKLTLKAYKHKLQTNPDNYFGFFAELSPVDQLISALQSDTFDSESLPPLAKNGELASIVTFYSAWLKESAPKPDSGERVQLTQ